MSISLGIVMDPIDSIHTYKDSSFAMMLEAQARNWSIWYMEQSDLCLQDNRSYARMRQVELTDSTSSWFSFGVERYQPLDELDVILMRKDPPFDMEYVYTTYILEQAERSGTLVVNRPSSLRDANEKLFTAWFPDCCTSSLVSRDHQQLTDFLQQHGDIILKPLDGMGGASVFRVQLDDPNSNVIIETLTANGAKYAMAQRFLPEISAGDKRILMVDGDPIPYALARIPQSGDNRGNLAAGGRGEGIALSEQDFWIAAQVGPILRERGILFAGLDVIGDYLTEINVTSPTCIRELDSQFGLNISAQLLDKIESKIKA
ncbi:MAG: glutathione synthase [Gammaproteobacteria bacterium]|nr:glutathione synthase [Gammaproteobacteria bacterium]